jgi:hypothetical protein
LIQRLIINTVIFGLVITLVGCVCPRPDGDPTGGEKKPPLTEKRPEKVEDTPPGSDGEQTYVPGQVMVKLKPGVDATALDTIAAELGLETIEPLALPGTYLMKIISAESVESILKKLETYDTIEYGEPNYIMKTN